METSESVVGPTEDTIQALLELLVEPLLPTRSSSGETSSPSEEDSVAKQVHAVVILYNYYHRKNHPELEFLDLVSFCKLARAFKPRLLSYMRSGDHTNSNDVGKELSLMEMKIMEACDVSRNMSLSQEVSVVGWPINKVAVFLVDNSKKNCFLLYNADTQGVWSVIEKKISDCSSHPEVRAEAKHGGKRKRITKKPLRANGSIDETILHHQAVAAVKDACGRPEPQLTNWCSRGELKLLEKHLVCSMGKEKAATYFSIMLNKQPNQETNYVPVKDVIRSLQEPLVKPESGRWTTTSAVELFSLFPYAKILLDWFHSVVREDEASCEAGEEMNTQPEVISSEINSGLKKTVNPRDLSDGTVASSESSHQALGMMEHHGRGQLSGLQDIETGKDLTISNQRTCSGSTEHVGDISVELTGKIKKTEESMDLSDETVASNGLSHETVEKKGDYSIGKTSDLRQHSIIVDFSIYNQGTCSGSSEQVDNVPLEMIRETNTTVEPTDFSDGTVAYHESSHGAERKEEDCSREKTSVLCAKTGEFLLVSNQGTCSGPVENVALEMKAAIKNPEEPIDLSEGTIASNESSYEAVGKEEDCGSGKTSDPLQCSGSGKDLLVTNQGTCSGSSELVEDNPPEMTGAIKKAEEPMDLSDGTIAPAESSCNGMGKEEDCSRGSQYSETGKDVSLSNQGRCSGSSEPVEDILPAMIGATEKEELDLSDTIESSHEVVGKNKEGSRGKSYVLSQYSETGKDLPVSNQGTCSGSFEPVEDISLEMIGAIEKEEEPVDLSDTIESSHEVVGKEEDCNRGKTSVLLHYSETGEDLPVSDQETCAEKIGVLKRAEGPMDLSDRAVASDKSSLEAVGKEEDCSRGKTSVPLQYYVVGKVLPAFNQGIENINTGMIEGLSKTEDLMDLFDGTGASKESSHETVRKNEDCCREKASSLSKGFPISKQGTCSGSLDQLDGIAFELMGGLKKTKEAMDLSVGTVASNEFVHEAARNNEEGSSEKASILETSKDLPVSNQGTCLSSLDKVECIPSVMIGGMKKPEEPLDLSDGIVAFNESLHEAVGKNEDCTTKKASSYSQYIETGKDLPVSNQGKGSDSLDQVEDIPCEMICGLKKTAEPMDLSGSTDTSNELSYEAVKKGEDDSRGTSAFSQFIETGNDLPISNQGKRSADLEQTDDIPTEMIYGMKSDGAVASNEISDQAVGKAFELLRHCETVEDFPVSNYITCFGSPEHDEEVLVAVNKNSESQTSTVELIHGGKLLKDCQDASSFDETHDTVLCTNKNSHKRNYIIGENSGCGQSEVSAEYFGLKKVKIDSSGLTNYVNVGNDVANIECSGNTGISDGDKPPTSMDVIVKDDSGEKTTKDDLSYQDTVQDRAIIANTSFYEKAVKFHEIICSKDKALSETALRILHNKRNMLSGHLQKIEDEISSCDQNIQKILSDAEDSLAVKLDSILESCNNVNLRTPAVPDRMLLQNIQHGHASALYSGKKTLPESDVIMCCIPLEELDGVCQGKNWMSPTYTVSTSEVFVAKVTVKGMDFELSTTGSAHDTPDGAKESAALAMLNIMRNLAAASSSS